MKACSACGETNPADQFSKNKTLLSGLNSACKDCIRIRSRAQYEKHKEQRLADKARYRAEHRERLRQGAVEYRKRAWDVNKRWRTANREKIRLTAQRRRARILAATQGQILPKEIRRMLDRPCAYCGGKSHEIDHVIPLVRGGKHAIGNLIQACESCNSRKNSKLAIEWKASQRDKRLHQYVQQLAG